MRPAQARLLRAANGFYLLCVALLVFTPSGGASNAVILWLCDLMPSFTYSQVEVGLNVLMFVPLSLLGRWVYDRARVLFWLPTGFAASLSIELIQLVVPGRTTAVSDVIANTSGALIGVGLALGFETWGRRAGR